MNPAEAEFAAGRGSEIRIGQSAFRLIAFASGLAFIVLAILTFAELFCIKYPGRIHYLHTETMVVSGGQIVSGTGGYAFATSSDGVYLYQIELTPVTTTNAGPDGRPIAALFDPSIREIMKLRPLRMAGYLALSVIAPVAWIVRRDRQKPGRGFPLD